MFKWFRRFIYQRFKRCPICFRKLRLEIEYGDYGTELSRSYICPKEGNQYDDGACRFNWDDSYCSWLFPEIAKKIHQITTKRRGRCYWQGHSLLWRWCDRFEIKWLFFENICKHCFSYKERNIAIPELQQWTGCLPKKTEEVTI